MSETEQAVLQHQEPLKTDEIRRMQTTINDLTHKLFVSAGILDGEKPELENLAGVYFTTAFILQAAVEILSDYAGGTRADPEYIKQKVAQAISFYGFQVTDLPQEKPVKPKTTTIQPTETIVYERKKRARSKDPDLALNRNTFSAYLRKLRKENGLSQQELGQKLSCTQSTISLYENGERHISREFLIAFANALELDFKNAENLLKQAGYLFK